MTTPVTESLTEAVPFEDLTKDQMIEHLVQVHQMPDYRVREMHRYNAKQTKDDLVRNHEHSHRGQRGAAMPGSDVPNHVHTALTVEGASFDADTQTLDLAKPLTKSEATLTQLVNNDFDRLATDMRQLAADQQAERAEVITKEWEAKKDKSEFYRTKGLAIIDNYRTARDALVEKARTDGITLQLPSMAVDVQAKLEGKDTALREARTQIDLHLQRAQMALTRQKLTVQRQILLATVTPEAQKVLDVVPTAQSLMLHAAQEEADRKAVTS